MGRAVPTVHLTFYHLVVVIKKCLRHFNPLPPIEAAEKVDITAYIWYNVIIQYRRWYYG